MTTKHTHQESPDKLPGTSLMPPPYNHALQRFETNAGKFIHLVAVEIMVPSRIAALLPEGGDVHNIPSAGIHDLSAIAGRARGWEKRQKVTKRRTVPPLKAYLQAAIEEGCDTPITLALTVNEWHLVGMLCGKLGILPSEWFIACAARNAEVEEESIEEMLRGIEETPTTEGGEP